MNEIVRIVRNALGKLWLEKYLGAWGWGKKGTKDNPYSEDNLIVFTDREAVTINYKGDGQGTIHEFRLTNSTNLGDQVEIALKEAGLSLRRAIPPNHIFDKSKMPDDDHCWFCPQCEKFFGFTLEGLDTVETVFRRIQEEIKDHWGVSPACRKSMPVIYKKMGGVIAVDFEGTRLLEQSLK